MDIQEARSGSQRTDKPATMSSQGELCRPQHISVLHTDAKSSNSDVCSLSHLHITLLTFTSHRLPQLWPGGSTCSACQTNSRRQDDRPPSVLAMTQLCNV